MRTTNVRFLVLAAVLSSVSLYAQNGTPFVIQEVRHDVSPPLSSLPLISGGIAPLLPAETGDIVASPPLQVNSSEPDGRVQTTLPSGPLNAASVNVNFAGMSAGAAGAGTFAPPDTNGIVGNGQFVQWVNVALAVYNKTTGAVLKGPVAGKSLWLGFGGICENDNNGDPMVVFDVINNRWVLSQFAITGGNAQCVAVSTTSDATGTYNRYQFNYANFPDYPKMATWPDAYYVTYNMFGASFLGSQVCALDGAAMRAGLTATQVCFGPISRTFSLLPIDFSGTVLPAAGTAAYVMQQDATFLTSTSLFMWRFHVDFATPSSSTFIGPSTITVPTYSSSCGAFSRQQCIPQPGTTNLLESLGVHLMHRGVYTNAAGRERIVLSHTVGATDGSSNNVRWYEIRTPGTTPTVFQASTFAPDAKHRFMPSIAMDKMGNIAVGYTTSDGTSTFPNVAFTGRMAAEPRNFMEAEQVVQVGLGSQINNLHRWGDYSAMSVDPADGCTFYYTNEYLPVTGSFNWATRVVGFKFPNCN